MRRIALSSVAVLLVSGLFSATLAAPSSQALKRTPQDAEVNPNELVVIPIDDAEPTVVNIGAGTGSGAAKRSARPQTGSEGGLDTLVVIPIEDPEVPLPVSVGTGNGAASGSVTRARKVRKAW